MNSWILFSISYSRFNLFRKTIPAFPRINYHYFTKMNTTTYGTTIQIATTTILENSTETKNSPALNGADTCWVLVNGFLNEFKF